MLKQIMVRTNHCTGCKSCEIACAVAHSNGRELFATLLSGEKPVRRVKVETNPGRTVNLPVQCRQCREAKCVQACMTGAMHYDQSSGLVVNNEDKCVGCWMCVMVCPYGVIVPGETQKVAAKCDQCLSIEHQPACVQACPTKALQFIEISEFDHGVRREFLNRFIAGEEE